MKQILAVLTFILALAFALAPALTNPFTGFTADQLPVPQIDPPIQPAGYAFAIWGLIYLWLIASAGYGLWHRREADDWHRARLPLITSLGVGVPWLAIANASAIWATITIFAMAGFAIWALLSAPARDRWWFQAPTGLYAGWLTAASFVSLGSTMAGYGIIADSLGWAYLGIAGALTLAVLVLRRSGAPGYGAAVIWALVGIIAANGLAYPGVSALAALGVVVLGWMVWRATRMGPVA